MLPYYPISRYYHSRFGKKVYKLPVALASQCPPLENGVKPCIFCNEWGSAARPELTKLSLSDQILESRLRIERKYRCQDFLVYFQAYTSTYIALDSLKTAVRQALNLPNICGVIIGTRPDCISMALVEWLNSLTNDSFVSVELGVQSFLDRDLEFLKRGHGADAIFRAIERLNRHPAIDIGAHLILGLPEEREADIIGCTQKISQLPLRHVKLHNLQVLKGTPLHQLYLDGRYQPISEDDYIERVILFLTHLPSNIAIQRISTVTSNWDELIAPEWNRDKLRIYQKTIDLMRQRGLRQGTALGVKNSCKI